MKMPKSMPRMWDWVIYMVILMALIWWVAPQQLQIVAYKAALMALAVILAYMADRALFKRVRDRVDAKMPRDVFSAARLMARALVFLGVVLGITLGI
jgi:hypothetical protein